MKPNKREKEEMLLEDKEIVELYWQRKENAIYETDKKYRNYLRSIAMNVLNSKQDAEECVNDTYLGAWNAIPDKRPDILPPFIGRITRNISLNKYNFNTAKKRNVNFTMLLSELDECVSGTESVEQQYEKGLIGKAISDFLEKHSSEISDIFVCRYWYSDSIKDIAKRFDMSESKVKSLLLRTRNKLKIYLDQEGYNL
jgi:RNA polymerase sigma-70 factor (ECF subfamily)